MDHIIKFDKFVKRINKDVEYSLDWIKFIIKATSTDNARPALQTVKVDFIDQPTDGFFLCDLTSTDGFRIHHARVLIPNFNGISFQPDSPITSGTYELKLSGDVMTMHQVEVNFPDIDPIFPRPRGENNTWKGTDRVGISPAYLADLEIKCINEVVLHFNSCKEPIYVTFFDTVEGNNYADNYAVIMPMHIE